jgi:Flp pilus assembly CpaE family ATPase
MLAEVQPRAKASEGVRHLAELVTGRAVQQISKKSGMSILPFLNRKAG